MPCAATADTCIVHAPLRLPDQKFPRNKYLQVQHTRCVAVLYRLYTSRVYASHACMAGGGRCMRCQACLLLLALHFSLFVSVHQRLTVEFAEPHSWDTSATTSSERYVSCVACQQHACMPRASYQVGRSAVSFASLFGSASP